MSRLIFGLRARRAIAQDRTNLDESHREYGKFEAFTK